MSTPPLKVAVIGLGVMGARHARAVAVHPGASLTAVVDIAPVRDELAKELGCAGFADYRMVIGKADAAIVAVPTALHGEVAAHLIEAGIACLVEKPFVGNRDEGRKLIAAAEARNVALQAGHIERFNPAVIALLDHVADPYSVRQITARRISAASARVKDIDVIMDLMVHDIDVATALVQQPVTGISAMGDVNHAKALLTFRDGATAALTASRTEPGRIRDLNVALDTGTLEMDYIARTLNENGRPLPVHDHDALNAQLSAFLAAVRGERVVVSASEAMSVMDVAWRIQAALGLKP